MDWKNIIAEIQRHGQLTQAQIAEKVVCGQATVSDLANGTTKQPNFLLGQNLMALHKKVSRKSKQPA